MGWDAFHGIELKEIKVRIPAMRVVQLHSFKVLHALTISEQVDLGLDMLHRSFNGRPEKPCSCQDCFCQLHTYEDRSVCLWCNRGQHGPPGKRRLAQ